MTVLDSSAMLAFLHREPEAALVEALLISANEEGEENVYAHAVNLIEVYYDLLRTQTPAEAEAGIETLRLAGVTERRDLDDVFWREIATLIAAARALPPDPTTGKRSTLALGDGFGVCLANRLGASFVTKDRSEIEPLHNAGLAGATFLR